ncbi:helix-turn-helix domain-containing protein [Sphingobacterium sp. DK4209]|uniref:Helix-turn-helix domain-containing protein n=1 Tax=Sphingobacterium zhuxiongii TaxID=2662364 RepID=A0A5Q0QD71_9SPHI|nr:MULTISPECIES: helix-turn-helix domain-containing protein [unclassified Sphingobacterium]MVZ67058.1 helix-turn-helix domain-containing protein [Sphingobacterium sp. DK4209]QGA26871.1 helix-turn-helix domain-containing protein [Sphingobacterium sp. dk4302]
MLRATAQPSGTTVDTLAKYSNEQLFDKAFHTHRTFYLEYLEKRKLSVDEFKMLYQEIGRLLITEGKLDSSILYYTRLDSLAKKNNDTENQMLAQLSIAEAYNRKKKYKQSQKVFENAQPLIAKLPEGVEKILANVEYSYFYYLSGKFELFTEQNLKNYTDLLAFMSAKKDVLEASDLNYVKMARAILSIYMANGYTMQENFAEAEKYLKVSKEIIEKNFPNDVYTGTVMLKLAFGQYYLFTKEFKLAIPYLQEVIRLGDTHNYKEFQYKARVFLAIANYQYGDFHEALKQSEIAIHSKIAVADYIDFEMEALRYAYLSSKELGATDKAMEYSKLFIEQDAALNDNRKSNFVNSFINNLEVHKLEEDIKDKSNTNYVLRYSLVGVSVLIVGLLLFTFYQLAENKKSKAKIKEYMDKLEEGEEAVVVPMKKGRPQAEESNVVIKDEIDDKTHKLLDKLVQFEHGDLFVDSRMSLSYLASYLGTNTITLSKIINTYKEMNFNDYINGLRIRYIIERIKNEPKFEQYKISYLAEVSGFSSHSIFSKAFKKSTGVTPSQFLDYLKGESV